MGMVSKRKLRVVDDWSGSEDGREDGLLSLW